MVYWDHEEKRYDGIPIWKPGTLVSCDLSQFILIDDPFPLDNEGEIDEDASPKFNLELTMYYDRLAKNNAANGNNKEMLAMILDIDPGETFYKILLDEKVLWYPVQGCKLSTSVAAEPGTA